MTHFVGLDVSQKMTVICVVDKDCRRIWRGQFLVGDGGLLLLAVDDVLVDGERLDGVGVTPTIEVAFDPRYAAGSDPQLERAVQILARG